VKASQREKELSQGPINQPSKSQTHSFLLSKHSEFYLLNNADRPRAQKTSNLDQLSEKSCQGLIFFAPTQVEKWIPTGSEKKTGRPKYFQAGE